LLDELEHFHKCCSGADSGVREAVFLTFDFVLAQSQGYANLLLRQRPMIGTARQKSKILAPLRYIISVNALNAVLAV